MAWHWGYSPKVERYIPLGDFPPDQYLVIVRQAIINIGWNISYCSEESIIAYTGLSWQSYSEEISVRISSNFAIVRSECVGIQLCFTDYGKNDDNLEKFFHEFDYVEYHFAHLWQQEIEKYHADAALSDDKYLEQAPLAVKSKINDFIQLLVPRKGYRVTPVLLTLNILFFISSIIMLLIFWYPKDMEVMQKYLSGFNMLLNGRSQVLSGEYWRLLSSLFVHGSVLHIVGNMCALSYIGLMVENKLGWKKYLTIYILSGIAASTTSIIFHPVGYAAGASGAIMGMFGAFLALLVSNLFERNARKAMLLSTILVIILMLLSGMKGRIDNAAHIGGLISGFLISLLYQVKPLNRSVPLGTITVSAVVFFYITLAFGFLPNYQLDEFKAFKDNYRRNILKTKMVNIARYGTAKDKKLKIIREVGINSWKDNKSITSKMKRLVLPARLMRRVIRMDKVATMQLATYNYLYREAAEGSKRYRPRINRLNDRINNVFQQDRNDPVSIWKAYLY